MKMKVEVSMIQLTPFYVEVLCKVKNLLKATIIMLDLITITLIMKRIEYTGKLLMRVALRFQTQIIIVPIRRIIQMTDKLMMMII